MTAKRLVRTASKTTDRRIARPLNAPRSVMCVDPQDQMVAELGFTIRKPWAPAGSTVHLQPFRLS
jgi:hypothetical protein